MITMKRNLIYSIISMLSMVFLLTSCNNYTFETPAYESISAKYIATSPYSDIKSLELSSSGNYIVIKNNGYYESYNIASRNAFVNNLVYSKTTKTRSAEYENIIYGKFTKIDENKYELEGYGTVIITKTDDDMKSYFSEEELSEFIDSYVNEYYYTKEVGEKFGVKVLYGIEVTMYLTVSHK